MGASSSIISPQDTKSLLFGALRDGKNVHRNEQLTLSQSQNEVKRYRQALRRWVVDANIFQFPASPTTHNNTASNPSSPLPTQVLTELELLDQNLLSSSGRLPAAFAEELLESNWKAKTVENFYATHKGRRENAKNVIEFVLPMLCMKDWVPSALVCKNWTKVCRAADTLWHQFLFDLVRSNLKNIKQVTPVPSLALSMVSVASNNTDAVQSEPSALPVTLSVLNEPQSGVVSVLNHLVSATEVEGKESTEGKEAEEVEEAKVETQSIVSATGSATLSAPSATPSALLSSSTTSKQNSSIASADYVSKISDEAIEQRPEEDEQPMQQQQQQQQQSTSFPPTNFTSSKKSISKSKSITPEPSLLPNTSVPSVDTTIAMQQWSKIGDREIVAAHISAVHPAREWEWTQSIGWVTFFETMAHFLDAAPSRSSIWASDIHCHQLSVNRTW